MKNVMLTLAVAVAMASCSCKPSIEGVWETTTPCGKKQGISLEKDGIAKSCHFKGMKLENWKQEGDLLILSGQRAVLPEVCANDSAKAACSTEKEGCCKDSTKVEGACTKTEGAESCCKDKTTEFVAFSDTFTIVSVTAKELVLTSTNGEEMKFTRVEGCPDAKCGKEDKKGCCKEGDKTACANDADKKACDKEAKCCEKK